VSVSHDTNIHPVSLWDIMHTYRVYVAHLTLQGGVCVRVCVYNIYGKRPVVEPELPAYTSSIHSHIDT
jgi:hypothetical protein